MELSVFGDFSIRGCFTYAYGEKARPSCQGVKFHCANTGPYDSKKVKIRASLNPLSRERQSTMGSVSSM